MKKNGFTLIEVLTVLIILSIVVLIAVPVIEDTIKESRQKAYITQMQGIEEAAKMWASEHIYETPTAENNTKTLTLEELIQNGYVDKNMKNPKTKQPLEKIKVIITYESGNFVYTVYDNEEVVNFD